MTRCQRPNGTYYGTRGKCRKGQTVGYEDWNVLAEGNFGRVLKSPDGSRVVKTLLERNGEKGEFGPFEVEIATKMGRLGFSPRIHSHSDSHIEMDTATGSTLWKSYQRGEDEPTMNTQQAKKAGDALRSLHRMGYYHGDMHSQQWLVDGNNVKLVDYGLSGRLDRNPVKAMQDLAKINSLVVWSNPDLKNDPYFSLVNRHLSRYQEVKGTSAKAKREREQIALDYIRELNDL